MRTRIVNREWDRLTERYRKRLVRYGITPSYYESGGTVQRARGHKPREHITRKRQAKIIGPQNDPLTASEDAFIRRQEKRWPRLRGDFTRQRAAFFRANRNQREMMMHRVSRDRKEYIRQKKHTFQTIGDLKNALRDIYSEENINIDLDEMEDIYPDFDGLEGLLFYH